MPKTGRSLIGTVAGFKSEWWPVFDRNGGRLHVGIRTHFAGIPVLQDWCDLSSRHERSPTFC